MPSSSSSSLGCTVYASTQTAPQPNLPPFRYLPSRPHILHPTLHPPSPTTLKMSTTSNNNNNKNHNSKEFVADHKIEFHHVGQEVRPSLAGSGSSVSEEMVLSALAVVLDRSKYPLLIACNLVSYLAIRDSLSSLFLHSMFNV